jgi:hypothetical protein
VAFDFPSNPVLNQAYTPPGASLIYKWKGDSWIVLGSVADAGYVRKAGDTMSGLLTLSDDPSLALEAATKRYVDNAVSGITAPAVAGGGGQCYLSKIGSDLVLSPYDGNRLNIGNVPQVIPDGGVSLAPAGTAAATRYYIYAFLSAGSIVLEYSTTAYSVASGLKVKTGDTSRTLVGMWATAGAGVWSSISTEGISYFNPRNKTGALNSSVSNGATSPVSTSATAMVELASGYRQPFISFANREVDIGIRGRVNMSAVGTCYVDIGLDGVGGVNSQLASSITTTFYTAAPNEWNFFSDRISKTFTEARHYVTGTHCCTTGGTLTTTEANWYATVRG